jgi:hypothetical protein
MIVNNSLKVISELDEHTLLLYNWSTLQLDWKLISINKVIIYTCVRSGDVLDANRPIKTKRDCAWPYLP